MANYSKIVELSQKKTKDCRRRALLAIQEIESSGEKITFYKVEKLSQLSKGFLYHDPVISKIIREKR